MARQDDLNDGPFNRFICSGCGKPMGKHWIFRPDKLTDVAYFNSGSRRPDGRFYCHRDGSTASPGHFQRVLRRSLEPAGYKT